MEKELDMRTIERISKEEGRVLQPLLERFIALRLYEPLTEEEIKANERPYNFKSMADEIIYLRQLIKEILIEIIEIKKEIKGV